MHPYIFIIFLIGVTLSACEKKQDPPSAENKTATNKIETSQVPSPPQPPIRETFEGTPQLSLFARLGDYRPESSDEIALPFWNTYQEHLVKTSGVTTVDDSSNRAYGFRTIRGLDSVGFFSPLAVEPNTTYRVTFRARAQLPEEASAGVGILEYDEFLWINEQYPESFDVQHRTGQHDGAEIIGDGDWHPYEFAFTTTPRTAMIHLVLYREGAAAKDPVFFDDITIEKAQ